MTPDYKRIYSDMLAKKFPHRKKDFDVFLNKKELSILNIIELNKKIFGTVDKQSEKFNQKHRSYRKSDIMKILDHQKKYKLNNSQLANHFKLSRNTIAKWKKMFYI